MRGSKGKGSNQGQGAVNIRFSREGGLLVIPNIFMRSSPHATKPIPLDSPCKYLSNDMYICWVRWRTEGARGLPSNHLFRVTDIGLITVFPLSFVKIPLN